jgi:phosphinothricin acetyltransferase
MRIVDCSYARHHAAILDLFNDAIRHTTALYEYEPRSEHSMGAWFEDKRARNWPVIGAETASGTLMGFASFGVFRPHPAYKYTIEHSVYVHRDHRRKGVASRLMHELIQSARKGDFHVMVGGIDATNTASIAMHEKLGFTCAGTIRHAGFKFGRWLDLTLYQLILDTPLRPAGP